jgi:hypothetical protein
MRWLKNGGERSWIPKIHVFWVCLVCLLGSANTGWAESKAFYEDGNVQEGEVYVYVDILRDATVNMTGGTVTVAFTAYDSSIANISGGSINAMNFGDFTTLNLSGNATVNELEIVMSGTLNVYGGSIGTINVHCDKPASLYGGAVSDYLRAGSPVNIYGYGFFYDPDGGDNGGGHLTGFWGDETPFSFDLWASHDTGTVPVDTWSKITLYEIPEPCTLVLLALGAVIWPRRRR